MLAIRSGTPYAWQHYYINDFWNAIFTASSLETIGDNISPLIHNGFFFSLQVRVKNLKF